MEKIFEKIKNVIDVSEYHIFIKNKIILSAKILPDIKKKIKEDVENPKKDIKCFIIRISINKNYKFPLTVNCSQYTITPKLAFVYKDDDMSQTFTYSESELEKFNFKLTHLYKIMKALKEDLISFETSSVPITTVFNVLKK